ncbi:unnamed protein product [Caenorhabditis nigoni]
MENQRLTRRVAFLKKIKNNQQDFDGFTKEIDRMNALLVVRDAKIQELTKDSKTKVDVEGFEENKKKSENKSAKMKGHIKSLEKKLEASNDFRFKITEEMEALLEEDVNPNQTMCIKLARQNSEYHKEIRRKVRSNFEHMRKANSRLQQSLQELDQNLIIVASEVKKLETSLNEKEQNEVQMQNEDSELCKKFWDQTVQVEALIKMLEDKAVRIIADDMVIQEQQRYIQSLEQEKLRNKNSELEKMLSDVVDKKEKTHFAKMAKWKEAGIRK